MTNAEYDALVKRLHDTNARMKDAEEQVEEIIKVQGVYATSDDPVTSALRPKTLRAVRRGSDVARLQ